MPPAKTPYTVKRVALELADLLIEQGTVLASALAQAEETELIKLLAAATQNNAEIFHIVTLLSAGQATEAETAVIQLKQRRLKSKKH